MEISDAGWIDDASATIGHRPCPKFAAPGCRRCRSDEGKGPHKMRLPKQWLSYPVLIDVAGAHGSGFFVHHGDGLYLVSAKHVLFKNKIETYDASNGGPVKLSSRPPTKEESQSSNIIELDCLRLYEDGNLLRHERADVAVCRVAKLGSKVIEPDGRQAVTFLDGVDCKVALGLGGLGLDEALLFADVVSGGEIILFGYPTSLSGDFFAKETSLLRSGIVAGKTNNGEIVIDCPVYFGNSGALVLETELGHRARAIGVAIRMIPFKETLYSKEFRQEVGIRYENSGYAIVEPMDRVIELIDRFKPLPKEASSHE